MTPDPPARPARRALLTGGALALPALALAGCQSDDADADVSTADTLAAPNSAATVSSASVIRLSVGPDTGEDVTEAFAEAMAKVHPTQATTILLDRGEYLVRSITIPANRSVILRGMGIGFVGGSFGTRIRRYDDGTDPLLLAEGHTGQLSSSDVSLPEFRVRLELYDLELHGNETSGEVLRVFRGQQCHFQGVRVGKSAGTAVHVTQMFNSSITRMFIGYSGQGAETPAMLIDGTDEGSPAGTNTLHLTDCEWETNAGTDLVIDGFPGMPSVAVLVTNAKMERGAGDYPLVRVTSHGKMQLSNSYLYLGSNTDHHLLETSGSTMLSNVHLAHGGAPDYQVVHAEGLLMAVGLNSEARLTNAVVRVASEVTAGRCVLHGLAAIEGNALVHDERNLPVRLGQRVVPVQVVHSSSSSVLLADGTGVGWRLGPVAEDDACVGQAVMPEGVAAGDDLLLVLRWTTGSRSVDGGVVLAASLRGTQADTEMSSGRAEAQTHHEDPPREGAVAESVLRPRTALMEGELVRLQISRETGDSRDTFRGDAYLVSAHLLVPVAL